MKEGEADFISALIDLNCKFVQTTLSICASQTTFAQTTNHSFRPSYSSAGYLQPQVVVPFTPLQAAPVLSDAAAAARKARVDARRAQASDGADSSDEVQKKKGRKRVQVRAQILAALSVRTWHTQSIHFSTHILTIEPFSH